MHKKLNSMKLILTSFFIFCSLSLFSQMSLSELQNILKMDQSKFETYCLNNQFTFNKVYDDENVFGARYVKGIGMNTKYITFYDFFFDDGKHVTYQTHNTTEYLKIKTEMDNQGFKLIKTESYRDNIVRDYSNQKFEMTIYSGKDEANDNKYEINIISAIK